jgi:glycosyltransferase involved in cell wall biosynthesis
VSNESIHQSTVAVVVPCYNAAPFLARALDSVFAQSYPDFRVYVVDDGSTDNVEAVLHHYVGRVSLTNQPHLGQGAARNHAIRLSESPYVAFLDADDEWLPDKLQKQVAVLERDPRLGMVYGDCTTSGTGPTSGSFFARNGTPAGGRIFERLLNHCDVYTPTVIVRRECLQDVGLFHEALDVGEDYNLWLRIAARWNVAVIPEALAIRHISPRSLSVTTTPDRALKTMITAFEHVRETNPALPEHDREALRKAIAARYYDYGSYLLREGERTASRQQLLHALRYGSTDWRVPVKLALGFLPHSAFATLRELRQHLGRV